MNYYGKETIDTNTYGKSVGHSGSYSTNYQNAGRELLTPDEVRLLDNRYTLLFVRGERAIKDLKYDILKHPNVKFTTDGNGKPYVHGEKLKTNATIKIEVIRKKNKTEEDTQRKEVGEETKAKNNISKRYIVLNEIEIEKYINGGKNL